MTDLPTTSGPVTTPAALADQASLCAGGGYPAQWTWDPATTMPGAVSATSGTPRIDQVRNGVVIATYTSFCDQAGANIPYKQDGTDWENPGPCAAAGAGPFTREHNWRLFAPGDVFNVYPAVYSGPANNPYFGPVYTGDQEWPGGFVSPDNVVVRGIVQNGQRPVISISAGAGDNTLGQSAMYFDQSTGLKISNINVIGSGAVTVGNGGLYLVNARDLSLSNMRVSGFGPNPAMPNGGNGIISANGMAGILRLANVELDGNGGDNGPRHNAYIASSTVDPNFTVRVLHCWSHNATYGHDFKSRAQRTIVLASYLEGGLPVAPNTQAEAYNLDCSNGGVLVVRGCVLVKNASGPDSNGISIAYGMEGILDARPLSIDIENNTFVAFARTFDGEHSIFPMSFFYPQQVPDSTGFAVAPSSVTVKNNVFVGYCQTGTAAFDYRGDTPVIAGFGDINEDFTLSINYAPASASTVVGTGTYRQVAGVGPVRTTTAIGAFDPPSVAS